ncbi:MAG TPA: hypothetical protein VK654_05065 [Nitrospirota bacterium]|nr:hypothetical protein [Nitrospirota bacterium]
MAEIEKKNIEDGSCYLTTSQNELIEAGIYGRLPISLKSRTLSAEQTIGSLLRDSIKNINITQGKIDPKNTQAITVEKLFPSAFSFLYKSSPPPPIRLIKLFIILSCLYAPNIEGGRSAAAIVTQEIQRKYSAFSFDESIYNKRLDGLRQGLRISLTRLSEYGIPKDTSSLNNWFSRVFANENSQIMACALCLLFIDNSFQQISGAVVKKDSGLGAKQNFVRLSKTAFPEFSQRTSLLLYNDDQECGALNITWHTDNKQDATLTHTDIKRFGLQEGQKVNLLFQ